MGKAIVQAELEEIAGVADQWACSLGLISSSKNIDSHLGFRGKLYSAMCQCYKTPTGTLVNINIRPRFYIFILLHMTLLGGLCYCFSLISELVNNFSLKIIALTLAAIGIAILIHLKDRTLPAIFSRMENTFWDKLGSTYDTTPQTRATGQILSNSYRIFTEFLLAGFLIAIGYAALAAAGVIALAIIVSPFLIMVLAESLRNDNPQWHWRLWIMGNMARWTYLMLAILGVAATFSAWEIFYATGVYRKDTNISINKSISEMRFRDIQPATADALESDTVRIINASIDKATQSPEKTSKEEKAASRKFYKTFYEISVFVIICISVFIFSLLPFYKLLLSQKIWNDESYSKKLPQSPSVPYLPQSWRIRMPRVLQALILFHCFFGGIINIAATIFCFDGMFYAFAGRTFLIRKSANIWSIIFAHSKYLWGDQYGQVISIALVFLIAMPIIAVFVTLIRRLFSNAMLYLRVITMRSEKMIINHSELEFIKSFVNNACKKLGIKAPALKIFQNSDTAIFIDHIPLRNAAVLQISSSAIELLDEHELEAAISHELGHISQGLWKISFLKALSSLALFPNHYLTLCLDWSRKEIKADEAALRIIANPNSLKSAIIKMSSARMVSLNNYSDTSKSWFTGSSVIEWIKNRWQPLMISAKFYWGDGLFGYAHPYLSERLENIDTYVAKAKSTHE